jgi:hypothetical protein
VGEIVVSDSDDEEVVNMFESNWQRKIEENKYDKLSYENSLKLILK